MKLKKKKEDYNYKNKISLVVLLIIIACFIFAVTKKSMTNKKVYKKGEITYAIVNDTRKVGGNGVRKCTYLFTYNEIKYEGWVYDDTYKIGDTIKIMFLKDNPKINDDYKFLQRINK